MPIFLWQRTQHINVWRIVGGKLAHIDSFVAHCACRVQCCDKVKDIHGSLENMLNVFSVLFVTRTFSKGTMNGGN